MPSIQQWFIWSTAEVMAWMINYMTLLYMDEINLSETDIVYSISSMFALSRQLLLDVQQLPIT